MEYELKTYHKSETLKEESFKQDNISVSLFHHKDDPQNILRLKMEADNISAVIVPTHGLSLHEAWIDKQPLFWTPPRSSLPAPENVNLKNPIIINGNKEWGTEWIRWFCSGVEMLGPDNWGMGVPEKNMTLHGQASNTPVDKIKFTIKNDQLSVTGSFIAESEQGKFEITKQIILHPSEKTILINDTIKNIAESSALPDWGYHIQFRAEPKCKYYIPSKEIKSRDNKTLNKNFNEWELPANNGTRKEYGYIHKKINTSSDDFNNTRVRTLMYYPNKKCIQCDIPAATFISSWFSAGGAEDDEFKIEVDGKTERLLSKNWDGVGPEFGASPLDHDGNINPQFTEERLKSGEEKKIRIKLKLIDAAEADTLKKEIINYSELY